MQLLTVSVLALSVVLLAGCAADPQLPPPYVNSEGGLCEADASSARKIRGVGIITLRCTFEQDAELNRKFGANYIATTSVTRRFDCADLRLIESTVVVTPTNGESRIENYAENQQVLPGSPVEKHMQYACAQ